MRYSDSSAQYDGDRGRYTSIRHGGRKWKNPTNHLTKRKLEMIILSTRGIRIMFENPRKSPSRVFTSESSSVKAFFPLYLIIRVLDTAKTWRWWEYSLLTSSRGIFHFLVLEDINALPCSSKQLFADIESNVYTKGEAMQLPMSYEPGHHTRCSLLLSGFDIGHRKFIHWFSPMAFQINCYYRSSTYHGCLSWISLSTIYSRG